jgi:iron complex transport system substrate-binding protein
VNVAALMGIDDFKPLSAEAVIAMQPDVLLVLEKGLESVGGVDGLLRIPGLADTPAGRNRQIVAFDDLYFLGMGPRTGQALADLRAALQTPDRQGRP